LRLRQDSTLSVGVAKETLSRLGVQGGETVFVSHIDQHAELPVSLDAAVLPGTVKVPVGYEHTIGLGTQSGAITLERLG
jgi:anaerobic selenocysteine-containing dehydrogenase